MTWSTSNYFPSWGDSGERPSDGFQYDGGEQVNEKHFDYFLNALDEFEDDVWAALEDIDSDSDGIVDEADDSNRFDGTAPSDGEGGQALTTDGTSTQWSTVDPSGNAIAPSALSVQDWDWVDVTEASDVATDGTGDAVAEIQPLVASNTLLIFPEGTYRFDQTFSAVDVDHFGMVARGDVTIESNNGTSNLIDFGNGDEVGLRFEGFDIDVGSNADQGGRQINVSVADGLRVKDITQVGQPTAGDTPFTTFQITSEDGHGTIENLDLSAGDNSSTGNGHAGILCSSGHVGQISFENCHVEGFQSNGVYLSGPGRYHIRGGRFKNCATAQLRLNGGPAHVEGAEIVVDDPAALDNSRGVWWRGDGPHHVEDCEIRIETVEGADPISVPSSESPGGLIENTHIRDGRNGWATRINAVDLDAYDDQSHDPLVFDNVTWEYNRNHGEGDQDPYAIRIHRPSTYLRDCHIEDFDGGGTASDGRHAVHIRASNVHVRGGTIVNDGWSINVEGNDIDNSLYQFNRVTLRDLAAYPREGTDNTQTSIVIGGDGSSGITATAPTAGTPPRDVKIHNVDTNAHVGASDTERDEQDAVGITDLGIRTIIDGVGTNQGDPNIDGDWSNDDNVPDYMFRWPPGTRVVDTVSNDIYEYNAQAAVWETFEQVEAVKDYEQVNAQRRRTHVHTEAVSTPSGTLTYDDTMDDQVVAWVGDGVTISASEIGGYPPQKEARIHLKEFSSQTVSDESTEATFAELGQDYLATGGGDNTLFLYDIASFNLSESIDLGEFPHDAALSDDYLAVSTGGTNVFVYEIGTWNLVETISAGHPLDGVAFGGDGGEYLAFCARGGYVRVYDTSTWEQIHEFTDTGGEIVRDVDMNENWLIYGSWDSNSYVRPVNPDSSTAVGALQATLDDHAANGVNVEGVAVGGGYVAHGGGNNEVYVYDTTDFTTPATTLTDPSFVSDVDIGSNYLTVGDNDSNATVYSIGDWTLLQTYTTGGNVVGCSEKDAMVAFASGDATTYMEMPEQGSTPYGISYDASFQTADSAPSEIPGGGEVEIELKTNDGGSQWYVNSIASYS